MGRDLRETALWDEVERFVTDLYRPGFGTASMAADPCPSPDGTAIAFTGTVWTALEGVPATHIFLADRQSGAVRQLTTGGSSERLPRFSPDGSALAFLSDRAEAGVHQLHVLDGDLGEARALPIDDCVVEYFSWSPDGTRLLACTAERGADQAGGHGSGTIAAGKTDLPTWMPEVETGAPEHGWRAAWVVDPASGDAQKVTAEGMNVWEAVWCGDGSILAVVSPGPSEDLWYSAKLALVDVVSGATAEILDPVQQIGVLAASANGRVAAVEAVCSDRWVVAGDVVLLGADGDRRVVDTGGVDVTWLQWRDDDTLIFAGLRGLNTVAGEIDASLGKAVDLWSSSDSCGGRYPEIAALPDGGITLVAEGWSRPPELIVVVDGAEQVITSFANAGTDTITRSGSTLSEIRWAAPDGLEIEGLLVVPDGPAPHPLVVNVHGGPIWAHRNKWLGGSLLTAMLVARGFAVLLPNPRGSGGRGQAFAATVVGDMGGSDTDDYLSGIDALVERGLVDPHRLAVTGASYGGFMTCWLVTQTDRFKAAAPVACTSNWYSFHATTNITSFDAAFLDGEPRRADGLFHARSPIMFADRVTTPCLNITGALDRCTPPTQAVEFHRSLLDASTAPSELVIYPEEGHGVRCFPAQLDYLTRIVGWFERYLTGPGGPHQYGR